MLAIGAVTAPVRGAAQTPRPTIRKIAALPGVDLRGEAVPLPNGRVVLYTLGDSVFAYDLMAKRRILVTSFFNKSLSVSSAGNRIAFRRPVEGRRGRFIWSLPINPTTGAAAGPAQPVGATPGGYAGVSPDGELVAFTRSSGAGAQSQDLVVVPATGGAERHLATYGTDAQVTAWSDDGKWIFVEITGDSLQSIERAPVAGGPSERVFSSPRDSWGSIAGRVALYWPDARAPNEGRIAYLVGAGGHGEFAVPPGSRPAGKDYYVRSPQSLFIKTTRPTTAHLLSLADGKARKLASGSLLSRGGVWSPDSRRIALLDSAGGHCRIEVMDADGSRPRWYPATIDPATASVRWSPDGRLLAYYGGAGDTTVTVLDPATGKTRRMFSASDATYFDFTWRPDGRTIVLMKYSASLGEAREIYEARLDGISAKLRNIDNEYPYGFFLSDRLLFIGADGSPDNLYAVLSTSAGAPQKLPRATGLGSEPGVSADGTWLLFRGGRNPDGQTTTIDLMTTSGDSARTLNLPFLLQQDQRPIFTPDGRGAILLSAIPGDSSVRVFLVPLDGSPPRVLATLSGGFRYGGLDLSPDGKLLAFTTEGVPTSTIYELDLRPLLARRLNERRPQ